MKTHKLDSDFITMFKERMMYAEKRNHSVYIPQVMNKREIADCHMLCTAFGGTKSGRNLWSFTYNPVSLINMALTHGFIPIAKNNFAFMPTQVRNSLSKLMTFSDEAKILYPYFGYERLREGKYHGLRILTDEKTEGYEKYDAIVMRPDFSDRDCVYEHFDKLVSGGEILAILSDFLIINKDFVKFVEKYCSHFRATKIPAPTWSTDITGGSIFVSLFTAQKR